MLDLSGKAAVVTGAGSGIGRGIALAFARAGADVVCSDAVEERAEAVATEVRGLGRKGIANRTDVRSKAECEALAVVAANEFGRLDIMVANAGIARGGGVLTMREDDWDMQMDVNLKGVFLSTQACAREMVRQDRGGRIILISSIAGERPNPYSGAYAASKAGVRMLGRVWSLELAPLGITVNSIGPGIIDTPLGAGLLGEGDIRAINERIIPVGRAGIPTDIGNLACWLASDEAEYVTGQYHVMDGGLLDANGWHISPIEGGTSLQPLRDGRRALGGRAFLEQLDAQTAVLVAGAGEQRQARGLL